MFGKGLKWEFEYTEIEDFSHTDGVVLEMSAIPFIKNNYEPWRRFYCI